ncbi:TetR/AcrR family transcriptional regulator [Microbacterium enclense]|uniref:TetR/AcrR family transcriptional regulator n=2 Tax=Microbacterium enclense TaxID=993073 RepID=A0A443J718_9MICO|nr:TetR/AcrR family transcriptional regulator [Microbacterium enclense]
MSNTETPPNSRRGRRPAAPLRSSILDAALQTFEEGGMGATTFERVSRLAGASKTTLYKWWPSPAALVAEAHFGRVENALAFPDTGDLEADLTSQLRAFVEILQRPGIARTVTRMIGAAQDNEELAAAWSANYSGPRRKLAVERFEQAKHRGHLREDIDAEVLVDQLWGACYHRLLIPDQPLTEHFAAALVSNLCRGILNEETAAQGRTEPSPI